MTNAHSSDYELVVVGCGGVGSAVLYHAAQRCSKVLGLEQFSPVHDRGSSHGQSRIIRQAYFEHPNYVPLLLDAYTEWHRLESAVERQLFVQTGLLQVGPPDGDVVPGVLRSAQLHQLPVDHFNRQGLGEKYPCFKIPSGHEGVFEHKAGYLKVEACVQSHLDGARRHAATLAANTQLLQIHPYPEYVELQTLAGSIRAQRVVITVGAWLSRWLQLETQPLTVLRKHMHWFATDNAQLSLVERCPIFLFDTPQGCFYGLPILDERGLKVSEHSGGEVMVDANHYNREVDPVDLLRVTTFLGEYLVGAMRHQSHAACMYTMTRDQHFLIDRHPEDPRIFIAGGFSGHGFKFASILGKLIAEWALDGNRDPRLDFLTMARP